MNTTNRIAKWSVIVGIVIVLNLFFNYALSLIYKEPEYTAYCPAQQVNKLIASQNECVAIGGQWNDSYPDYYAPKPIESLSVRPAGYCDPDFTCRKNFEEARKTYERNVFVTLVILGALAVLAGTFLKQNDVVTNSLSMAGVLSFIIASIRYWGSADDLIRVLILAIALIILFGIAIRKFRS